MVSSPVFSNARRVEAAGGGPRNGLWLATIARDACHGMDAPAAIGWPGHLTFFHQRSVLDGVPVNETKIDHEQPAMERKPRSER